MKNTEKTYKEMSSKLESKCNKAANVLLAKMEELHIKTLEIPSVGTISRRTAESNIEKYSYICWQSKHGDLCSAIGDSGRHIHGDFNCWVPDADEEDMLLFANAWTTIQQEVRKIEDKKIAEAERLIEQPMTLDRG